MYDNYLSFDTFVGKTVEKVLINSDRGTMMWKVDGNWYRLNAVGDCCSYSWYEHCDNASVFDNAKLIAWEDAGGEDEDKDWNVIRVNMLKFKTEKGDCTIEFRNESNGYYSGWVEFSDGAGFNEESTEFKVMVDF
jgi:hypothetical protein